MSTQYVINTEQEGVNLDINLFLIKTLLSKGSWHFNMIVRNVGNVLLMLCLWFVYFE